MSDEFIQQVERLPAAIAEKFDFRVERGSYLEVEFINSLEENLKSGLLLFKTQYPLCGMSYTHSISMRYLTNIVHDQGWGPVLYKICKTIQVAYLKANCDLPLRLR